MLIQELPSEVLTHGGKFHADDVFSGAFLRLIRPNLRIQRAFQVPEGYSGLVFDLGWGPFDHHQQGAPVRENGIPYAAFGLLWKELGAEFLRSRLPAEDAEREARFFDESFVQPLDLDDNTGCGTPLASVIADFNPPWDSTESPDDAYEEAVCFAKRLLEKRFSSLFAICRASSLVRPALAAMQDHIVILDTYCPWKQVLAGTDAWFVVYPSQRGGYSAQTVPPKNGSGGAPMDFPSSWAGKTAGELQTLTGLPTLRFCHNSQFLIAADTVSDAVSACYFAIQAKDTTRRK